MSGPARWRQTLSRGLYNALLQAAVPLLRRKLRRRGRQEPGYLLHIEERFGHYDHALQRALAQARPGPRIWLHAVSLGETRAAGLLIQAMRQQWPKLQLVLTSSTATGRAEGARHLRAGDLALWLPWDSPQPVQRFVRSVRPDLGLIMETEVWPNLLRSCAEHGIPTVLVNARLNAQSARGALRWPALMQPAYQAFTRVLAQSPADAQRLRAVGARQIHICGNIKYDAQPDPAQIALGRAWRAASARPVALLASSRAGEEQALLAALAQLADNSTALQWLLVPRHPQRFEEVEQLAQQQGWRVLRRSQWGNAGPAAADQPPTADRKVLWLGDSMGEMALYYSLAELALLGGSFEPLGGQNLIEAAACGCPVLMGPHTYNFAQACAQAEASGAARRVSDLPTAVQCAQQLLTDGASLAQMRTAAQQFVAASQGALGATVQVLAELLQPPSA
jgi:3-deoxy-D-manno-octulosonic-acid transferase